MSCSLGSATLFVSFFSSISSYPKIVSLMVSIGNFLPLAGNQYFNLSMQLKSGVRLIQAQGHRDPDGTDRIRLCHFNCALMNGASLDEYLVQTKAWLEENPDEGMQPAISIIHGTNRSSCDFSFCQRQSLLAPVGSSISSDGLRCHLLHPTHLQTQQYVYQ